MKTQFASLRSHPRWSQSWSRMETYLARLHIGDRFLQHEIRLQAAARLEAALASGKPVDGTVGQVMELIDQWFVASSGSATSCVSAKRLHLTVCPKTMPSASRLAMEAEDVSGGSRIAPMPQMNVSRMIPRDDAFESPQRDGYTVVAWMRRMVSVPALVATSVALTAAMFFVGF